MQIWVRRRRRFYGSSARSVVTAAADNDNNNDIDIDIDERQCDLSSDWFTLLCARYTIESIGAQSGLRLTQYHS